MKVVLTTLNAKYIHTSLGLRYLRESSKALGHDVVFKEYSINQELLTIVGDICRERPDVVALGCYIWSRTLVEELVDSLKQVLPQSQIVLGGPEVGFTPQEALEAMPGADAVVLGEGETVLPQWLEVCAGKRQAETVNGVAWRKEGRIVVQGGPQAQTDLAQLPFPYQEEEMASLQGRILYYETTRGCPFSCQYCLSSAQDGVRYLPLARIKEEVLFFLRHGVKQIKFVDRTFNARKDHYRPLWSWLASLEGDINFHFEIAAGLLEQEDLDFLATVPVGRFQLEIGVQSTHEPTLEEIQRRNYWEKLQQAVSFLRRQNNMHLHLDLIVGLPYEGWGEFHRSFNEVFALRPHMLQMGFLKMLPASGLRQRAAVYQYRFLQKPPYTVLASNAMSAEEIRKLRLVEDIVEHVYNGGRFQQALNYLLACWQQDAFACFSSIAAYWDEERLDLAAMGVRGWYRNLLAYAQWRWGEEKQGVLREWLRLDALLSDGGQQRPPELNWNGSEWEGEKQAFWRDEEAVRQYIPEYAFGSWRELKRKYHLEFLFLPGPDGRVERHNWLVRYDLSEGSLAQEVQLDAE